MKAVPFNTGWVFRKGEEAAVPVTLPHDAMLGETRVPGGAGGTGGAFFPGGFYTYEKTFDVPADWAEKTVGFAFDGVYRNARVKLNGVEAADHAYGYTPFTVCADGLLKYGEANTLTVEVDNSQLPNSRWYSGSGIYRPVHLLIADKTHILWQGVRITTLSIDPARILVETKATAGEVSVEILDGETVVAAGKGGAVEIAVPDAKLWSDESPALYTCRVTLTAEGQIVDVAEETFGIRMIEWSEKGLFVNGRETLLRGGCIHHDNGVLGAAAFEKSEFRKVRMLKAAGFNALRSAHNPASTALVRACDFYGVYLMDEGWDMWYNHKNPHDYASQFMEHYVEDLEAMVARDYNHPAVLMYSIGNEVSEPANDRGVGLARDLVFRLHELDDTRPVTAGLNLSIVYGASKGNFIWNPDQGGRSEESEQQSNGSATMNMTSTMFNMVTSKVGTGMNKAANSKAADRATSPVLDVLDIAGYNYASGRYPLEKTAHPHRVVVGSETFPQDIWKNWQMVKEYPYLIGDFMWTAWDYLGEAGIGAWSYTPDGRAFDKPYPWLLADAGAMDILGDPTGELFLAQAAWGLLKDPAISVRPVNHPGEVPSQAVWRGTNSIPTWSWQNCEGNAATVEVYGDGSTAQLLLNGKSIGKKNLRQGVATFKTKYAPGILTAVIFDADGKELGRSELRSSVGKPRIRLTPEENSVRPGEIVYVPVTLVGGNGILECNSDRALTATVTGGTLLGFGSANPRTEDQYTTGACSTYYGRAMAVVLAGDDGEIALTVSDGKQSASVTIPVITG